MNKIDELFFKFRGKSMILASTVCKRIEDFINGK